ncbi:hypothetical protein D9M70_593430 [compost metagenome]
MAALFGSPFDRGDQAVELRQDAQDVVVGIDEKIVAHRRDHRVQHDAVSDAGRVVRHDQGRAGGGDMLQPLDHQITQDQPGDAAHDLIIRQIAVFGRQLQCAGIA